MSFQNLTYLWVPSPDNTVFTETYFFDEKNKFEHEGLESLTEARKNKHYSQELKLAAVLSYLNGEGTLEDLVFKYGLRAKKQLIDWLSLYNKDKTLSASPYRKQRLMSRKTTLAERIEIVEYVTKYNHSYSETAEHFAVSYQQARSWVLKAKQGGYEALIDNRGHRNELNEMTDLDKANLRIRQLEAELKKAEITRGLRKKISRTSAQGVKQRRRLTYQAINEVSQGIHGGITILLEEIGVSRQVYYKGLKRETTEWEKQDQFLKERVQYWFNFCSYINKWHIFF